ncbi:MAG: hypothetical protein PUD93_07465 [Lachnospiraceae bacterium]|nr:hypothetical protein [Lachnospiraceae bacterium]
MENLLNADILADYLQTYGAICLSGFGITVLLHYVAYGIFGSVGIIKNTKSM